MTIESATYLSQLNETYPEAGSACADVDDHLRLIKATIKATFPNITGAVTASHVELNLLAGAAGMLAPALTNFSLSISALGAQANSLSVLLAGAMPVTFVSRTSLSVTTPISLALTIPANTRRIHLGMKLIAGVSKLQIGPAGGIETTGYASRNNFAATATDGFYVAFAHSATVTMYGSITLTNVDDTGHAWVFSSQITNPRYSGLAELTYLNCYGTKVLAGPLTQLQFIRNIAVSPIHFAAGTSISVHCEVKP